MLTKAEIAALRTQNAELIKANYVGWKATEFQGLLDHIEALEKALEGANWIISKLAPHEATAIAVRGWRPSDEDVVTGAKYRQMIDAALKGGELNHDTE